MHDRVIISENGYEDMISDHPTVIVTQGKIKGRGMLLLTVQNVLSHVHQRRAVRPVNMYTYWCAVQIYVYYIQ